MGTFSDRKTLVKMAAKSGVAATITRVLAAVVRRIDMTKETVLAPNKTPARIPAYPIRKTSRRTPFPWVKRRVTDRVQAVRSPRQKTRVQGSTVITEMRRASGLRITIADTMRRVPLTFSFRGVMGMVEPAPFS